MKRSLVVLALVSLVFAGVASAEVRKGDLQLDLLGGWTQQNLSGVNPDGGDPRGHNGHFDMLFGALRPGIALTDNIRVAGVGFGVWERHPVGHEKSDSSTTWGLGVSAEYVFMPANQLNPYVGGMVAWAHSDESVTHGLIGEAASGGEGWLFAPRAGVLFTMNRTNNLFAEYQYQMWTGDLDPLRNGHMILIGIEHKFKAGQ
jgi:hypothetical protein